MTTHETDSTHTLALPYRDIESAAFVAELLDETEEYCGGAGQNAFGAGRIVFYGDIRLSPVAGALLSLLETSPLPGTWWMYPSDCQLKVRATSNGIAQREVSRVLANLLPPGVARSVVESSPADVCAVLKKHGIKIAHELEEAVCRGMVDNVWCLLTTIKNDRDSNIRAVHFQCAISNTGEQGRCAGGYFLHVSDTIQAYWSTQKMRHLTLQLDLALNGGHAASIEQNLNEMIHETFLQIRDPDLRAGFAALLLRGNALRLVVSGTTEDGGREERADSV